MNKKTVIVLLSIAGALIVALSSVVAVMLINSHNEAEAAIVSSEQEEKIDKTLKKGLEYYENEKYEDAINFFSKISKNNDAYEKAQEMLEKSKNAYRNDMLTKADEYFQNEEHEVAMNLLKNALKVLPEDSAFEAKYDTIDTSFKTKIRTEAVATAKEYADKNDFESALFFVKEANEKIGNNDEELSALYTVYSSNYENLIIEKADEALLKNGYESAISIAQQALTILPNSIAIYDAINKYESYAPVYLIEDIDYLTIGSYVDYTRETITDNQGVEYVGHYSFYSTWNGGKIEFDTRGKYKTFTGTALLSYGDRGFSSDVRIKIYSGEGKLLYQTQKLAKGCSAETFSVDITGVSVLVIELEATTFTANQGSIYTHNPILTNAYFSK